MKFALAIPFIILMLISCSKSTYTSSATDSSSHSISTPVVYTKVTNNDELQDALTHAKPGDNIVMANGTWNDVRIKIANSGTEDKPITLSAETAGKVFIKGQSDLKIVGDYITVKDLYFLDGFSPSRAVISFAEKNKVANHCIVTNCVIKDYNKPQRNKSDLWIHIKGRHNQVDHCYLSGKSNRGPTVRVDLEGNPSINNHHKIVHNHFGPRPPKGGPSAETIQIGNSHTSMCPSYTLVANNLFEECNGEVEVISSKTNFNEFRNNVFYKSEGSLVTRHGNYCTVDGNYFIGNESNKIGGIRLIGTGHTVTNNYFYNLRGENFRSPLAVMNGIPKSPLNRYIQVTDVTIAHNSWIDCTAPLQFGVGSNVSQKDVLPASEIRSARPKRTVVANNLIYNNEGDPTPVVAHDKLDGIQFESNVINNQGVEFESIDGIQSTSFDLKEIADYIYAPTVAFTSPDLFVGFGFEDFDKDLFGVSRSDKNAIGAISGMPTTAPPLLDRSQYGPDWFEEGMLVGESIEHFVSPSDNVNEIISQAAKGDVVTLSPGEHTISSSLIIDKELTITADPVDAKATLKYEGPSGTPLFEMNPTSQLKLSHISLVGDEGQQAFASLKENMSSLYNLDVVNCTIEKFDFILKAYKYSFAEDIKFSYSRLRDCNNGIELSEETDDKGDYNAENITISKCTFDNIESNVIDYYRGGYDESTVGGNLVVSESTFTNCGAKEKNGILLNTYGIINVELKDNRFIDNKVKQIAQLWGAQNNRHSNNEITNSGEIVVEENLKLKTFY